MNIRSAPDVFGKLALVGDSNEREVVGDLPLAEQQAARSFMVGGRDNIPLNIEGVLSCITRVATPAGSKPILKAMVTTACEMDCYYCPFRAGRTAMRRVTFKPDELASAFDQLQRAKLVDGIFLSSGIIKGGAATQDRIIDTIEIIRRKYGYTGYVHLKIMPGAEYAQVVRAMQLADRVSINLEGPTQDRLDALAPRKDLFGDLFRHLQWTQQIRQSEDPRSPDRSRASTVTQLVVGAVGDTDLEHLALTERLYRQLRLKRAYYSAFHPVSDTPFENRPAASALRELRLYQSSFLLRDYDWEVEELPFLADGSLRQEIDPKRAWADEHLAEAPVEVMTADRKALMRVPGIGPKGADAILKARRKGHITELKHLGKIGVRAAGQAAPYILLDGRRPPRQLPLFDQPPSDP
jgi:predicted DNA-binding helix-hairpin-helix protein